MKREVDRKACDASVEERPANRVSHTLLPRAESVEEEHARDCASGGRKLEDGWNRFAPAGRQLEGQASVFRSGHRDRPTHAADRGTERGYRSGQGVDADNPTEEIRTHDDPERHLTDLRPTPIHPA
jgi:hypothetical protein